MKKINLPQDPSSEENIQKWINDLGSLIGSERLKARLTLIRTGAKAVPELIKTLSNGNQHARLEAARALTIVKDSSAASALVRALEDEDHDVRWASMKALIALERAGLEALLQALMMDFASVWLREGAHHVLNVLKKKRQLRQPSLQVLQALEGVEPEVAVPWAAQAAWETLCRLGKEQWK